MHNYSFFLISEFGLYGTNSTKLDSDSSMYVYVFFALIITASKKPFFKSISSFKLAVFPFIYDANCLEVCIFDMGLGLISSNSFFNLTVLFIVFIFLFRKKSHCCSILFLYFASEHFSFNVSKFTFSIDLLFYNTLFKIQHILSKYIY